MWAMKAVRFGYKWFLGIDIFMLFWEDIWSGNSPLGTLFWDIYCIVKEKNKTVFDLLDGVNLKCSFRTNFSGELMVQWFELEAIVRSVSYTSGR